MNALITREKLEAVRDRQIEAVKAYQTAVEVSQQRYLAGKSGYFEVLEAQPQLVPAENALAHTELDSSAGDRSALPRPRRRVAFERCRLGWTAAGCDARGAQEESLRGHAVVLWRLPPAQECVRAIKMAALHFPFDVS